MAKSKPAQRRSQTRPAGAATDVAATSAASTGRKQAPPAAGGAEATGDEAAGRRARRRRGDAEAVPAPAAPVRPATARSPRIRSKAPAAPGGDDAKPGLRARASQRMLKVGFMRRRYAKRLVRYIDRQKAKGRPLPPEFAELERFLAQVPKAERAQRFEEALALQQADELPVGREMRRAAANQQRRSGKNPAGYRPGAAPRSLQARPPKGGRPR